MKNKLVVIPTVKTLIVKSPGFAKKHLSDYKLDLAGLCGFGCSYCSSNMGNFLRINREKFAALTEQQTGERTYPSDDPALSFVFENVIKSLDTELRQKPKSFGAGQTLMVSMLTDAFSPELVKNGTTEAALFLILQKTSFRIRVLTKNAIVGSPYWVRFFSKYRDRVVVGLSAGSTDSEWAKRVEIGTSVPRARLWALTELQKAGVPTFGMLCPIFPDVIVNGTLDDLIDRINPAACETVWAEPYNDRANWQRVRDGYPEKSATREWFDKVYGEKNWEGWSAYAAELYARIRERATKDGWIQKLKYLLYEDLITAKHAETFRGFQGLLLQSKPEDDGLTKNKHLRLLQAAHKAA